MQHQNNAFCFILPFLFPKYICPLKAQALCAFSTGIYILLCSSCFMMWAGEESLCETKAKIVQIHQY